MNRGVPPTPANARTGEFTPPGVTASARENNPREVASGDGTSQSFRDEWEPTPPLLAIATTSANERMCS